MTPLGKRGGAATPENGLPEQTSGNFSFLAVHDAQLVRLGALAERYFKEDPATCLIKLRQYGETLAQLVAAKAGLFRDTQEPQTDLLRRLKFERVIPEEVGELFHHLCERYLSS
jgi:type I restriction enzyme R subunit